MSIVSSILSPFRALISRPARWLSVPKRLFGLALPARIAVVLGIFLWLCLLSYLLYVGFSEGWEALGDRLEFRYSVPGFLLLVGLPWAAYYTTKVWIEVESTRFPDIDAAWKAGLDAIGKAGIDLSDTPLFLAIGIQEANAAHSLMSATAWDLVVDGKPDGSSPLRWYATRDAVVVVCQECSGLSFLQGAPPPALGGAPSGGAPSGGAGASEAAKQLIRGTMIATEPSAPSHAPKVGLRGTIVAGAEEPAPSHAKASQPMTLKGTMIAFNDESASSMAPSAAVPSEYIDRTSLNLQSERLGRVCELARQARQPFCPYNGILATIPWKSISSVPTSSLSVALRQDVLSILKHGKLHAPILFLISGMEIEGGFTELVRRVGEDRAHGNRFGHSFSPGVPPQPTAMVSLAGSAASAFESWVYDLFRQPDCLTRPNNDRLFAMLCRVRSQVHPKLIDLLMAFSESVSSESQRSLFLGGCYFAATGNGKSRQAFLPSVMSKLVELQEELQWTDEAIAEENRYSRLVQGLMFVNMLLILGIAGVVFYWVFSNSN